jgi:hypothetical protein
MRIERIALAALLLFAAGCATEHFETGARNPEVAITADGGVTYRGKFVDPEDLPGLLKDSGLTKRDTINIHAPEDLRDMRAPRRVMAILSRNGFTRPILISDRKSYTELGKSADERRMERRRQQQEQMKLPPNKRTIRYK